MINLLNTLKQVQANCCCLKSSSLQSCFSFSLGLVSRPMMLSPVTCGRAMNQTSTSAWVWL